MNISPRFRDRTGLLEISEQLSHHANTDVDYIDPRDLKEIRWREGYGLGVISDGFWRPLTQSHYTIEWNMRGREIVEWIRKQREQQEKWRQQAQESPAIADALDKFSQALDQLVVITSLAAGIPEK